METVVAFNTELSGLYESKPPISKAKMTSITRSAMKAIKFYKHVVQSVEKFILKCKQEYKIPGLYVIDSIVRQSRHQFGAEKDVFAPRFARNMQTTFANLYQCSPEDKSKIIRVLNLWQKNNVFAPEVIQPLFDLANPNHAIYQNQSSGHDASGMNGMLSTIAQESPAPNLNDDSIGMPDVSGSVMNANAIDTSTIRHLQQLMMMRQKNNEPIASTSGSMSAAAASDSVKFNKKLLDYDYGDDEDDDKGQSPRQSQQFSQSSSAIDNNNISQLLNDPNVLRQLHNLQKLKQMEEKQSKLAEMRMQEEAFEKQLATMLKKLPFANECDLSRQDSAMFNMQSSSMNANQNGPMFMTSNAADQSKLDPDIELISDGKVEVINLDGNSRSPSVERDRYGKRRRSRSRSRDRLRRRRSRSRSGSRSRSSRRRSSRDRDRDRGKDKEKERERKRKGLPEIKKEHLSVCSTTLWIGHLSKLTQQEELSDIFTKYGDIVSIDMIHPRGCAFLVMNRRQDAYKAIDGLNGYKLHGRVISISWAAGKGVKSKEWKDYWDLELGVSYIPWDKLNDSTDYEELEEGGMFDDESIPLWLKEKLKNQAQKKENPEPVVVPSNPVPAALPLFGMDTTQPPPSQPMMANVPQMVPPFPMAPTMGGWIRVGGPSNMSMPLPPPMNGMVPLVPGMPPTMTPLDKPPPNAAGFFFPPIPQMPPMAAAPLTTTANSDHNVSDDQMDIEDESDTNDTFQKSHVPAMEPMFAKAPVMFNRPPPKFFAPNAMQPAPNDFNDNNEANDRGSDQDRDKDFRNRRDNRRDFGDRGRNSSRWSESGRSRENDRARPSSRDRNDRHSPMHDRMRANDGNGRDFNSSRNSSGQWPAQSSQMNFSNSNMNAPPALEDIRIPIESLRGMPMLNSKSHHTGGSGSGGGGSGGGGGGSGAAGNAGRRNEFDRRPMAGQQGRDFYNQNRFGPPINGPPMMRGNMQPFGPRNQNPMFMWQPRAGLSNNDRSSDGNFNRNERNRGGNNRGSRHWKDSADENGPPKSRNSRSFDGQRDKHSDGASSNNDKQSNDGDAIDGEHDTQKSVPAAIENNGESKMADTGSDPKPPAKAEERPFPRIQIKTPSKLAQEYCEQQKQLDDQNRTNSGAKPTADVNTTPLYDEPVDSRQPSVAVAEVAASSAPPPPPQQPQQEAEISADISAAEQ